jgi:glycosyltransferase involved in cell wall biosynthesis
MNILLINHYAGSLHHGMEYRPYYLAREWVRMGHQVSIVASSVSHVRTVSPKTRGGLTTETIDGINYCWLKTPDYQGNGIKRGINILTFVFQLYRYANKWINEIKPDLIITSSTHPLDNIPGKWIAKRAGAKLIYEVHDLWPLSLIELGGMSPGHPFIQLLQWAENFAYRNADLVVSLLPQALPHMTAHGLQPEKFIHIPNGIDIQEWGEQRVEIPIEHRKAITTLKQGKKLLIGYTGAHGLANALDTVLDAARILKNDPIGFVLTGQGPEKKRLQERCAQEGIENVLFLPAVTKPAVPSLLAEMDVLYIGLKSESLFRFGVSPNKLMDYMMAGKPVLYAISAGNDPVAEAQCGISLPPENAESLAQFARQLLEMSSDQLKTMGAKGYKYCKQRYDYRNLAARFLNSIAEV